MYNTFLANYEKMTWVIGLEINYLKVPGESFGVSGWSLDSPGGNKYLLVNRVCATKFITIVEIRVPKSNPFSYRILNHDLKYSNLRLELVRLRYQPDSISSTIYFKANQQQLGLMYQQSIPYYCSIHLDERGLTAIFPKDEDQRLLMKKGNSWKLPERHSSIKKIKKY